MSTVISGKRTKMTALEMLRQNQPEPNAEAAAELPTADEPSDQPVAEKVSPEVQETASVAWSPEFAADVAAVAEASQRSIGSLIEYLLRRRIKSLRRAAVKRGLQ